MRAPLVDEEAVSTADLAAPVAAAAPSDGSWAALARAVFAALLKHGTLTRAAIAELTGLSRVTASGLVDQLIRRGFVVQAEDVPAAGGGPNARAYALAPDSAYAVGVAINDYAIAVMTTSLSGAVVSRHEEPIVDIDEVVPAVEKAIRAELAKLNAAVSKLRYVVLGASGVVEPTGHALAYAVNRPSWKTTLAARLRPTLPCPIVFENDVNLAALAEAHVGAGAGLGDKLDMALVWLDEGIACGVIVGGRLYRGAAGWAGEIAFFPSSVEGGADNEPASRDMTTTTLQRAIGIRGVTALAKSHGTDAESLLRFVNAGHDAGRARAELARRIALAVAGPAFVFDPELIVLAGCVATRGGEALLEAVRAELAAIGPTPTKLALTTIESDAILTGSMLVALSHARDALFDDDPGNDAHNQAHSQARRGGPA